MLREGKAPSWCQQETCWFILTVSIKQQKHMMSFGFRTNAGQWKNSLALKSLTGPLKAQSQPTAGDIWNITSLHCLTSVISFDLMGANPNRQVSKPCRKSCRKSLLWQKMKKLNPLQQKSLIKLQQCYTLEVFLWRFNIEGRKKCQHDLKWQKECF